MAAHHLLQPSEAQKDVRVEVFHTGELWYPGKVIDVRGGEPPTAVKIKFDGLGKKKNAWYELTDENVRLPLAGYDFIACKNRAEYKSTVGLVAVTSGRVPGSMPGSAEKQCDCYRRSPDLSLEWTFIPGYCFLAI